jgi:hypothetical protein
MKRIIRFTAEAARLVPYSQLWVTNAKAEAYSDSTYKTPNLFLDNVHRLLGFHGLMAFFAWKSV